LETLETQPSYPAQAAAQRLAVEKPTETLETLETQPNYPAQARAAAQRLAVEKTSLRLPKRHRL
jgi:hypothetical protein